jgi:predicted PurR-regulated permease PerM
MEYTKLRGAFFISILLITLFLTLAIFFPYFNALILALALAVVFHPVYKVILSGMKKHPSIASVLTVLLVLIIILIPLIIVGIIMAREATQLYTYLTTTTESHIIVEKIQDVVSSMLPGLSIDIVSFLDDFAKQAIGFFVENIGEFFSNVLEVVISFFMVLFALYYLFKDGSKFKKSMITLSPLTDEHDRQIYNKLTVAVNSVIKVELLVALIQGILSGIGFAIFGVPNPFLLGAVAVIAALLPAVGVLLVFLPAVIYLVFTGSMLSWIGLALWGFLLVGLIDNFLRPKLIERGINIHPLLIFLSVLGGLSLFGPFGFLIGPLVLSLLFALLDIYREKFKDYMR